MLEGRELLSGGPPSVFVGVTAPRAVATDPYGDVFVSHIETTPAFASVVDEYSPQGALLKTFTIGSGSVPAAGGLTVVTGSAAPGWGLAVGDVLTLLPNGVILKIRPSTGAVTSFLDLGVLQGTDASDVYDVAAGGFANFSGTIDPLISTYGDLAVGGDDLLATGVCQGVAFVERVQLRIGAPWSSKILVASSATEPGSTQPRGVALNDAGLALTTLPVGAGGSPSRGVDEPVGFGAEFDAGKGPAPFLPLPAHVDSRSIALEGDGNFLIATGPLGTALGSGPGFVEAGASLRKFRFQAVPQLGSLDALGVAAGPVSGQVLLAMTDLNQVWVCADPPIAAVPGDFTGDGLADLAVFRPPTAQWFIQGAGAFQFGTVGDVPVPADYTGQGQYGLAVFRPSTAQWFIQGVGAFQFGAPNLDIPVPGDYDGSGQADLAVFRPTTAQWFIQGVGLIQFGAPGDIPVPADYDGDGTTDVAVYRPANDTFYVRLSTGGYLAQQFGAPGDLPIPGDYDGSGRAQFAVFRPATAQWFILGVGAFQFGAPGVDMAVPGVYAGAGKDVLAVYRPPTAQWFLQGVGASQFGWPGVDVPAVVPTAYEYLDMVSRESVLQGSGGVISFSAPAAGAVPAGPLGGSPAQPLVDAPPDRLSGVAAPRVSPPRVVLASASDLGGAGT